MAWVETASLSFVARHDSGIAEEAAAMLEDLETFRAELEGLFDVVPGDVAVVIHPRPLMMSLAAPWLPLARMVSAPAGRRYFAGFFGRTRSTCWRPPLWRRGPRTSRARARR